MAFKRKLEALNYPKTLEFNIYNDEDFRSLVVWLEDQCIRQLPIEDRSPLRKIDNPLWEDAFKNFLEVMSCPFTEKEEVLDWLLGLSVRLEYGDNVEKYKNITAQATKTTNEPQVKQKNPLDNMDFESSEFKACVASLADLLQVSPHPDHLETLSACCTLIQKRFSKEALLQKEKGSIQQGKDPLSLMELPLGFETKDPVLDKAAKILRLCFIHDLRDLQTKINEVIVSVQSVTANPKTDTRLGKVGR